MVARKCNEGLPVTAGNLGAGDPCRLDSSKSKFSDLYSFITVLLLFLFVAIVIELLRICS